MHTLSSLPEADWPQVCIIQLMVIYRRESKLQGLAREVHMKGAQLIDGHPSIKEHLMPCGFRACL